MKAKTRKILNITSIAFAVVVAIVVAISLFYGVCTHEEGGLLEACWVNGEAHYVKGHESPSVTPSPAPCSNPEKVVWNEKQTPVVIRNTDQSVDRVFRHSLKNINGQLGYKAARLAEGNEPASCRAFFGKALGRILGKTSHWRNEGMLYCEMWFNANIPDDRTLYLSINHEALHALGLGHDNFAGSAMYHYTDDDTWSSRMDADRISDHDKVLMRGLYLRKTR